MAWALWQDAPPSGSRRRSPPEKRVRMERDALEGLLFRLFERQARPVARA